jgi:hypothetical protein
VKPGFVADPLSPLAPSEPAEPLTIEVPRHLTHALQAGVNTRKHDPERRTVGSMKSIILEASVAHVRSDRVRE